MVIYVAPNESGSGRRLLLFQYERGRILFPFSQRANDMRLGRAAAARTINLIWNQLKKIRTKTPV